MVNSAHIDGGFALSVEDVTVTTDEEGLITTEIIFSYEFNDGVYGFSSMTILPDGSVITDSNFDIFVAEIQSRSDEYINPEVTILNLLKMSPAPSGKPGSLTPNGFWSSLWDCLTSIEIELKAGKNDNGVATERLNFNGLKGDCL
jgi:hypothetical protein